VVVVVGGFFSVFSSMINVSYLVEGGSQSLRHVGIGFSVQSWEGEK
jgi:hypothetical protein